jgi:hypothetical protein
MNSSLRTGIILMVISGVLFILAFLIDLLFSVALGQLFSLFTSVCCMISPLIFIAGFVLMIIGLVQKKPSRPTYRPPPAPPKPPRRPPNAPPGPDPSMLQKALNYEKAERWEDAAVIYEKLGLWEEAGRCRRRARGKTVKHVHVNANELFDQIRTEGLAVDYRCPKCGGHLDIDGSSRSKYCKFCGSPIDTETLSKLVEGLLK